MSYKHHPRLWWRDLVAEQAASSGRLAVDAIVDFERPAFEATLRGWLPAITCGCGHPFESHHAVMINGEIGPLLCWHQGCACSTGPTNNQESC